MTRISTDKLLRKPYLGSKVFFWCSDAQYLDSPDKNYYLTFSHFNEPHMGLTVSLFNLVNKHNEIVEKFESLTAFGAGDGGGCLHPRQAI